MSIDTMANVEIIASSHTIKKSTYTCHKSDSYELLHMAVSPPYKDDDSWFDAYENDESWFDALEPLKYYNE